MVAMCSSSDRIGGGIGPGMDRPGDAVRADGAGERGGGPGARAHETSAPGCDERFAGRGRSNPGLALEPNSGPDFDPELDVVLTDDSRSAIRTGARENMIIEWLRQRSGSMREYLKYLVDSDFTMNQSLRDIYSCSRSDLRLALALFIDFAHEQRLGPGELAPLMSDAHRDLLEAVCFVIGSAVREAGVESDDEPGAQPRAQDGGLFSTIQLAGAA